MTTTQEHNRNHRSLPLVRLGQGDYQRDIYPHDLRSHPEEQSMTTTETLDLGFLIREPADVYHAKAVNHLSSHWLAEFRHCPLLYHRKRTGLIPQRDSTAFLVGRAAHTLILEGRDRYNVEFAVGGPINPKTGNPFGSTTKKFAEWAEKIGKPVLSDDQAALVEQMAAAVRTHIFASELLSSGTPEGVIRCQLGGHACQVRLDWINPVDRRGIVDLKTADNLDTFEAAIETWGYIHQLAFYRAALAAVTGLVLPVHIIAVEKREPYRCGVWVIGSDALNAATDDNAAAMARLTQCQRHDIWPTGFESLRKYDQPQLCNH